MNINFCIDWKFVVATGLTTSMIIFAVKLDRDRVEEVSFHIFDTCKHFLAR